jgi:hypothetical protein
LCGNTREELHVEGKRKFYFILLLVFLKEVEVEERRERTKLKNWDNSNI